MSAKITQDSKTFEMKGKKKGISFYLLFVSLT